MKSEFGHCTVTTDTVTSESAAYRAADRGRSRTTQIIAARSSGFLPTYDVVRQTYDIV